MARATVDLALAVFREPGLLAEVRERTLPDDIGQVIRIAAGESAAREAAVAASGASAETVVEACVFFLQQTLFAPGGDSYRVLGARPGDPQERLREHYRWLMKWLHPDRNRDGWEALHADRVNVAWQDLKTPDRRAEYDQRAPAAAQSLVPVPPANWRRPAAEHAQRGPWLSGRIVRNLPAIVLASLAAGAMLVVGATYWARSATERELAAREAARDRLPAASTTQSAALEETSSSSGPGAADMPSGTGLARQPVPGSTSTLAWDGDPVSAPVEPSSQPGPAQPLAIAAVTAPGSEPDTSVAGSELSSGVERQPLAATVASEALREEPSANAAFASSAPLAAAQAPVPAHAPPAVSRTAVSAIVELPVEPVAAETVGTADAAALEPARSGASAIAASGDGATAAQSVALVAPVLAEPAPVAVRVAPVRGSAEALVREFVAAYAAGDRGRFDRLLATSGRGQASLADMRRRLDTTDMRFLEISGVQWRLDSESARASASFRDTYVPRGSRKAVTEAGTIDWEIRIEGGDHRIAGIERNAGR